MENASLPTDIWDNLTTSSSSEDDDMKLYVMHLRNLALKIVYIIMGTVGVLDNLFVIIVFALFIKITDKVLSIFVYQGRFNPNIVSVGGGVKSHQLFLNRKIILHRVGPGRFMTFSGYGVRTKCNNHVPSRCTGSSEARCMIFTARYDA